VPSHCLVNVRAADEVMFAYEEWKYCRGNMGLSHLSSLLAGSSSSKYTLKCV